MDFIDLAILLSLTATAMGALRIILSKKKILFNTTAVVLGFIILAYSPSATALTVNNLAALGASDRSINQEQSQLEEDLKITPGGGHYSGIEYAQGYLPGELETNDETIKESISAYTGDDVIIYVNNGAVQLWGTVKDKQTARDIIYRTKAIPAVHEITFDLQLENRAS